MQLLFSMLIDFYDTIFSTIFLIIFISIVNCDCNYSLIAKCLGQETAKEPCGLRVKLAPAHKSPVPIVLSITRGRGFMLSLFIAACQAEKL